MPFFPLLLISILLTTPACTSSAQKASQPATTTSSISPTKNQKMTLFNTQEKNAISKWKVVDDGVMGGRSDGNIQQSEAGNFVFMGEVSLENNGGFSSVRMSVAGEKVTEFNTVKLRLKGDGKRYQFRLKSDVQEYFSYIQYFETSGEWETITLKLADFYPTFRGQELDIPNYPGKELAEIAILIANGKAEKFHLEVEQIYLDQ